MTEPRTEGGERGPSVATRRTRRGSRQAPPTRRRHLVVVGVVVGLLVALALVFTLAQSDRATPGPQEDDEFKPTLDVLRITQRRLERDVKYWRDMEDGYLGLHRKDPDDAEIERGYADAVSKREDGERKLARVREQIAAMGEEP